MKNSTSFAMIGILVAALSAIALAALVYWHQIENTTSEPAPKIGFLPVIDIGGPFTLTDHNGSKITEKSFPGKFLLITFGYTFCPDICPTGLARITAALNRLGKTADLVQPLFISVDPNRDTPEALATYVTHFHPKMRGLTGNKDEIDSVTRTYRILRHVVHQDDASEYLLNHTTFFYLVAPTGKIARIFRHATGVDALADAISVELAQKS